MYRNVLRLIRPARHFAKKKKEAKKEELPPVEFDMDPTINEMHSALQKFNQNLEKIVIGRSDPKMFDDLYIPSKKTNLSSIAEIVSKNANELIVKTFDAKDVNNAINAIHTANIRAHVTKDNTGSIHIQIPKPSQELRQELIKEAKKAADETKQSIRMSRQSAVQKIKKFKHVSEDDSRKVQKEIQELHDENVGKVNKMFSEKERSISQS